MSTNAEKHAVLIRQLWTSNWSKLDHGRGNLMLTLFLELRGAANQVEDDAEQVRQAIIGVLRTAARPGETIS